MNNERPIFSCYEEIKQREIRELKEAVRANGGTYVFSRQKPIVLCNFDHGPADMRINSVELRNVAEPDYVEVVVIMGYDPKTGNEAQIDLFDIAYGHISFITDAIPKRTFSKSTFSILRLSREDLNIAGFDSSDVDDDTMEHLATKLGEDYCEQLFWTSLEIIAEIAGIPKKEKSEE